MSQIWGNKRARARDGKKKLNDVKRTGIKRTCIQIHFFFCAMLSCIDNRHMSTLRCRYHDEVDYSEFALLIRSKKKPRLKMCDWTIFVNRMKKWEISIQPIFGQRNCLFQECATQLLSIFGNVHLESVQHHGKDGDRTCKCIAYRICII